MLDRQRGARGILTSREGRAQAWVGASDMQRAPGEQPGKAKVGPRAQERETEMTRERAD